VDIAWHSGTPPAKCRADNTLTVCQGEPNVGTLAQRRLRLPTQSSFQAVRGVSRAGTLAGWPENGRKFRKSKGFRACQTNRLVGRLAGSLLPDPGHGGTEAFVSLLAAAGSSLLFSSYLGGSGSDVGTGIAVDVDDALWVTGYTSSDGVFAVGGAQQDTRGGGYDAFISHLLPLTAPVITDIDDDSGFEDDDFITNDQTLTLSGTGPASATITLYRAGISGAIGTTTSDGSGDWTFDYTGTSLAEGKHAFTATASRSGLTSQASKPYLVTVDLTAPTVTVTVATQTYDTTPEVRITAWDLVGLPDTDTGTAGVQTTVTLDVDLDNDGNFTDPGETGAVTGILTNGAGMLSLGTVSVGNTVRVRARVTDLAGNQGTSGVSSVEVISTGLTITVTPPLVAKNGLGFQQRGDLELLHFLDLDLSPGTEVGLYPALAYNSERVTVKPIIQAQIQTANSAALPDTITLQLTFNGVTQSAQVFSTAGFSPGEELYVAQQVDTAISSTGRYLYRMDVTLDYTTPVAESFYGDDLVVAGDDSPFGAGWSLAGVDRLIPIDEQQQFNGTTTVTYHAGVLRVYGDEGYAFYEENGAGYTSPAWDFGTLTGNAGSGWTYTTPDGFSAAFNGAGYQVQTTSADSFTTIDYTYSGNVLVGIETPDGALSTLTYANDVLSTIQTGSRQVRVAHQGTNVVGIVNPDGGLHKFGYDSDHHLTSDQFANLRNSFGYTHGVITSVQLGTGAEAGTYGFRPASLMGLDQLEKGPLAARLSDPLGRVTTWVLDTSGRVLRVEGNDGSLSSYTLNTAGQVTGTSDPLQQVGTIVHDEKGYTTSETLPDGSALAYEYQEAFHALTKYTDQKGGVHSLTYDDHGHPLTKEDPLGQVTSFAYSATTGLKETMTDALGQVTSYLYDAHRRLETIINPAGDRTTLTYDDNGNVATEVDELGDVTSYVNDALGRVLQVEDALGGLTTAVYNGAGYLTSETDWLGLRTEYDYDSRGQLTKMVDAVGTEWESTSLYTYDKAGQLISSQDANGNATDSIYDEVGNLKTTTNAQGNGQQKVFDQVGQALVSYNELGQSTSYSYDELGRVTATTDALGNVTTSVYDDAGNVTEQIDALGRGTTFAYDALNRRTGTTEAAGTSEARTSTTVYNAVGNVSQEIDWLGRTTEYQYDDLNRVTTITEAAGTADERVMTYAYDQAGNQVGSTDWLGNRTQSTYDQLNRRTVYTEGVGSSDERTTTTVYDHQGNVTSEVDSLGRTVSMVYDELNRMVSRTEGVGTSAAQTTTTLYDAVGNQVGSIDPLGKVSLRASDSLNRPVVSTDPLGNRSRSVYDAAGQPLAQVDPNGNRTDYSYDQLGRQEQTVDALGNVSTVVYDAVGNQIASIDARGDRTSYVYDSLKRQTAIQDALGHTATTVYDEAGNVLAQVDQLGHRTSYSYDALNRQVTRTDALGNVVTTVYDDAGNVASRTNARGFTTSYTYDSLNRQIQTEDALGHLATTIYDDLGNVQATIDQLGRRTTFVYDALNRLIATTNALNETTTTVYNAAGDVVQTIDALGFATTYVYDEAHRQVSVQDPSGGITTSVYDDAGNVVESIDPLGHTTAYRYDALNRLSEATDALGGVTTFLYDEVGNRTTVVDPVGNRTTFVYDALNRQTEEIDPLGHSGTMAYNAAGLLTSSTDRLGQRRDYSYDNDNRLLTETWRDSGGTLVNTLTHSYDENGNELTAGDDNDTYTFTYDALDRQATVQGLFGVSLTFTHDAVGNRTKVEDSFGGVTTSVYDDLNRLTSRQFDDGTTPLRFDQEYTARDQVGTITRYSDLAGTTQVGESLSTYDDAGRLENLQQKDGSGNLLANYTYTYDLASRVTSEVLNGSSTSYVYDDTNQLTDDSVSTYIYDANGNRETVGGQSYQTGTGNRLETDGVYTYTYDAEGNLTKKSKGASDETWVYSYDERNQLIGVQKQQTDGGTVLTRATYMYDVYGNRVEKQVWTSASGTTTTRFALDGWKNPVDGSSQPYALKGNENFDVWAELDGSNQLTMRRLFGDGVDQLAARISSGGTVAWYLTDRLGSVRNLTNSSGTLLGTLVYDGYGNVTTDTSGANGDQDQWTGRERDAESGLQYNRGRYYDPPSGRWLSEDPIGFEGADGNLFRYAKNNPTNASDPSGLDYQWNQLNNPYAGKTSKELNKLIDDGVIADKLVLARTTDTLGNRLELKYTRNPGQFYGEFTFKGKKPIIIAKCVPPNAINLAIWQQQFQGCDVVFTGGITWYNVGTESGAKLDAANKGLKKVFQIEIQGKKKLNYDDQVPFLDTYFSGGYTGKGNIAQQLGFVQDSYATEAQRKEIMKLLQGKGSGKVLFDVRRFHFDIGTKKITVKQLQVLIQKGNASVNWVESTWPK
jgi:RHS repeat-associated protein